MKFYKIVGMMMLTAAACGATACQKENLKNMNGGENEMHTEKVELTFNFSKEPADMERRAPDDKDRIIYEEGVVSSLLYAVFKGNERKHYKEVDFGNSPVNAGSSYRITDLKSEWFDNTTQVFALANAEDSLKTILKNETDINKWKDRTYSTKLNETAGANNSRVIDKPVMAGYLNLKDGVTDKISVQMQRIYCRIWFSFVWLNHKDAECVTIDEIKISGLHQHSKLFNYHQYVWQDVVNKEVTENLTIKNNDEKQFPFIGSLTEAPYYFGGQGNPTLEFIERQEQHNVLCRFTWENGKPDKTNPPARYYAYSLQKGGQSLDDDPLIEVKYHYEYPDYGTLYKKATARLYDKSSSDGKKHHGLLRNYTYRLNCIVNTTTNTMQLQVTAVPWYVVEINDIPSFE